MAARTVHGETGVNGWVVVALVVALLAGYGVFQLLHSPSGTEVEQAKKLATGSCGSGLGCFAHDVERVGAHTYDVLVWRTDSVESCYAVDVRTRKLREVAASACRAH
jgi:hypothetical protein